MLFQGEPDFKMIERIKLIHDVVAEGFIKNSCEPEVMRSYITVLRKKLRIILNRRLRSTAGCAHFDTYTVELHYRMMKSHPEQLAVTYAHELAHIIAGQLFFDRDHGAEWQKVMKWMGHTPEVRHTVDVSPWYTRARRHVWTCRCGTRLLGNREHKVHAAAYLRCLGCHEVKKYIGKEMRASQARNFVRALMNAA